MNPAILAQIGRFLVQNGKWIMYGVEAILYIIKLKQVKPMSPNVELLRDKLIKIIDEKTNTGWVDAVDQIAYKQLFNLGFSLLQANANPAIIELVNEFATSIVTGKDDEVVDYLTNFINGKIDLPKLDETEEAVIIHSILVTIAAAIRGLLKK